MPLASRLKWKPPAPLTTSSPTVELLVDVALTIQAVGNRLTALGLDAAREPETGPEVRLLLEEVLALVMRG